MHWIIIGGAYLCALCAIGPAVWLLARVAQGSRRRGSWHQVEARVLTLDQAHAYVPQPNGMGSWRTYLVATYEYADPRGQLHRGRAPMRGLSVQGAPTMPVLVDPARWDRSVPLPEHVGGCSMGAILFLLGVGIFFLLVGVMVQAVFAR